MRKLESKLSEAKTKKDMYIARARSAKASQQLNEMLGGVGTGTSTAAFERMEDRVNQMEAEAGAIAELNSGGDLESKFAELEQGGDIDDELANMKARISGSDPARLPSDERNL